MEMTYENQVLLRQVLQDKAVACDYRKPGSLTLAISEAQAHRQKVDVLQAKSAYA
jgi:hypothetical protein